MNVKSLIKSDFSGCVSIRKNQNVLFCEPFGYAELANQIPNEINTKFATASAGKVFVAVGILQLVEKGILHMEDTLGELLHFDLKDIDPDITVKQLLTHTSGIPDYFDESVMDEYAELWIDVPNYRIRTSKDLLPLFIDKPMMYPKGERFQYNNTGYVVLGLIIEKVTGMLFDEYLKRNIFTPCNMMDTGYYELDRLPAKCASNYIYDEERKEYYTNIYSVDVKGTGAGGAFTTALDVQRFWDALMSYQLLSEELTKEMLSLQATEGDEDYYGYGIWLWKNDNGAFWPFFQGSDPGVSFISLYKPEEATDITLVSNFGDDVWNLMNQILQL